MQRVKSAVKKYIAELPEQLRQGDEVGEISLFVLRNAANLSGRLLMLLICLPTLLKTRITAPAIRY